MKNHETFSVTHNYNCALKFGTVSNIKNVILYKVILNKINFLFVFQNVNENLTNLLKKSSSGSEGSDSGIL